MQDTDRFHRFADVLALVADDASPATRRLLLSAAEAWRELADEAPPAPMMGSISGNVTFVDFRQRPAG